MIPDKRIEFKELVDVINQNQTLNDIAKLNNISVYELTTLLNNRIKKEEYYFLQE